MNRCNNSMPTWLLGLLALLCWTFLAITAPFAQAAVAQPDNSPLKDWTGRYTTASAHGSVAELQKRIDAGQSQLKFDKQMGYLPALLEALGVSPTSQLLVFSQTSCQRDRISPRTPRAVYFNDHAYVAFIPNSTLLEISCVDPSLGPVFYTLKQKETPRPQLVRRDQCLECHTSSKTLTVPGYVVRSYATDGNGVIDITDGCSMVDHRTPLAQRWGGWYIGGASGLSSTRGHLVGEAAQSNAQPLAPETGSLGRLADLSNYPLPTSDIAALMVLEHQAHMQNLITRLQFDCANDAQTANTSAAKSTSDDLVRYLLFVDEVPLTSPIAHTSPFVSWFQNVGPKDSQGRSLRQFDLQTRLFKFPCSYMIYSEAFDALPRPARVRVYHRLHTVLTGQDAEPAFARIPAETRRAILEILTETKGDVPVDWKL